MTDLEWWLWFAFAVVGPLPLVWVWKWWRSRRAWRDLEAVREYRRQKFGGFVAVPGPDGKRVAKPLDRP